MSNIYQTSWWSLELPSGWFGTDDDGCISFANVDGVGALQISAYGSGNQEVTDEDLEELSRSDRPQNLTTEKVAYGQFVGLGICERTVTGYWRKYWLRAGSALLFVTYNCSLEHEGIEDDKVDRILHSLALSEWVSESEGLIH